MIVQCTECKTQLRVDADATGSPLCHCAKCNTVFYSKFFREPALLPLREPEKAKIPPFFYVGIIFGVICFATAPAGFFIWPAGFICIGIAIGFLLMNVLPYKSKLKLYNEQMAASENRLKSSVYRESLKSAVGMDKDVLRKLEYYCKRFENEESKENYIHETVLYEPKQKKQKTKNINAGFFANKGKDVANKSKEAINTVGKSIVANRQPDDNKQIYCHKCGAVLFDDSEFCHKCGAELHKKNIN